MFLHEKAAPVQVVLKERPFTLDVVDLQDLSEDEQLERIEKFKQQDQLRGFDLSKDSLMRASVFQRALPAIAGYGLSYPSSDGWCFGLVVQDICDLSCTLHDVPYKLAPVKPYKEYIKWLENKISKHHFNIGSNH